MSILLDALKKSEAQRRLGEVPTLQTNVPLDGSRDGGRHAWIPLALILLSAGIMSWTGIAQFRHEGSVPPSAEQANSDSESGLEVAASDAARPASVAEKPRTRASGNRPASRKSATTPVQDYDAPESLPDAEASQPESGRNDTVAATSRRVKHVEVESSAPAQAASAKVPDAGSVSAAGAPVVTDQEAYSPQTISYWQVPQSLREELGEFKISVLVYADNPADRFLLVNGSRLREQDKLEGGAILEEIQRDRAIFSYRSYRFHIKN